MIGRILPNRHGEDIELVDKNGKAIITIPDKLGNIRSFLEKPRTLSNFRKSYSKLNNTEKEKISKIMVLSGIPPKYRQTTGGKQTKAFQEIPKYYTEQTPTQALTSSAAAASSYKQEDETLPKFYRDRMRIDNEGDFDKYFTGSMSRGDSIEPSYEGRFSLQPDEEGQLIKKEESDEDDDNELIPKNLFGEGLKISRRPIQTRMLKNGEFGTSFIDVNQLYSPKMRLVVYRKGNNKKPILVKNVSKEFIQLLTKEYYPTQKISEQDLKDFVQLCSASNIDILNSGSKKFIMVRNYLEKKMRNENIDEKILPKQMKKGEMKKYKNEEKEKKEKQNLKKIEISNESVSWRKRRWQ